MRALRRVLILLAVAALVGIVAVRRRAAARSATGPPPAEPIWPPFEPVGPERAMPFVAPMEPPGPVWRQPVDGSCPEGFPIKANDNSGIYHVPGGRFYERTVPERCYPTPESAEADGYRRAKA